MNKTYRVEEIIFALRKEYLEIERQLEELKKYITIKDNVESLKFHYVSNPCRIILLLKEKKRLIDKIMIKLGYYIYGKYNFDVTSDIENVYYIRKKGACVISNPQELKKQINSIMQADFNQNIIANNNKSIPCNENEYNTIFIDTYGIKINGTYGGYPWFNYNSYRDEILIEDRYDIITEEDIYSILNLTIDSSYLNDYHRNIIDNYERKEIEIDIIPEDKRAKFKIIEEPKKLILRPQK